MSGSSQLGNKRSLRLVEVLDPTQPGSGIAVFDAISLTSSLLLNISRCKPQSTSEPLISSSSN